jgi:hypothetical protein
MFAARLIEASPGAAARSGHELDLFEAQMVALLPDKRSYHAPMRFMSAIFPTATSAQ